MLINTVGELIAELLKYHPNTLVLKSDYRTEAYSQIEMVDMYFKVRRTIDPITGVEYVDSPDDDRTGIDAVVL